MIDAFAHLWPHIDASEALLSETLVCSWPNGAFERLFALGLLRQASSADWAECPSCPDSHAEEVIPLENEDGSCRFSIHCSVYLRVPVAEKSLRQWTIDFDRLVALAAMAVGATGQWSAIVPGRLWRLGKVAWPPSKREALFARGLHLVDGGALAERIGRHGRAIVFVADVVPPADMWAKLMPAVVSLSQVATLSDSGVEIDAVGLATMIADADAAAKALEAERINMRQLKLIVRQEVKAEGKAMLTDDILVTAFRLCGSDRKAGAYLTEQTGQYVSKDKVFRAVKRAGGPAAVRSTENSDSVQRDVASQRRDSKGKRMHQAKPTKEE